MLYGDTLSHVSLRNSTQGNEYYKTGEYEQAVLSYEAAIIAYGPKAVYENNLAAALLKVGR